MFPWPPSEGRRVDGAPTLRTPLERRERNGSPQKSANRRMTEPRETGADDSNNNHQRSAQREQRHGGTQRLDMASRFIEGDIKALISTGRRVARHRCHVSSPTYSRPAWRSI